MVPGTCGAAVRWAATELGRAGVSSPRVDAEALLAHTLGVELSEVRRRAILDTPLPDEEMSDGEVPGAEGSESALTAGERFAELVARRAAREPLQHLTGVAAFRHLELVVGPGVFVPRPETEQVAQLAVDEAARVVAQRGSAVVVDLCTGSGAIALSVATEVPGARVHAVELDAAAHAWAARNVVQASTAVADGTGSGVGEPVLLVRGDARRAFHDLDGTVDVVVSNPPYVPSDAVPRDPEVSRHDPAVALYGLGTDGLEVPRGVTAAAARLLRPGGLYIMEHAEVQDAAARAMVSDVFVGGRPAFGPPRTEPDLTGRPRMVVARRADVVPDDAAADASTGAPGERRAVPDLEP